MTTHEDRRVFIMLVFAIVIIMLAGCGGTIVQDRPVTVHIPVAQPCAGPRPAAVVPLAQQFTDEQWATLDVRQKAAIVAKQGLDHKSYGEDLSAASAACP